MIYGPEHLELQASLSRLIATDINPYVDAWEAAGAFPAHEVFRKLGKQSLLGINKPVEFGGLGLDYTYATAYHETLGDAAIYHDNTLESLAVLFAAITPADVVFSHGNQRHVTG